ncbi:MAG: DUF4199 domain-containing protein [Bacteroidota bacterium]
MENENEIKKQGLAKPALQYGLILAFGLILISLIFYLTGNATSRYAGWISYPVIIAVLIIGIIKYRNEVNDGYISYGKSLGLGTLIGLFAGIFYAVYAFLFFYAIGPEVIDEILIKAEETILMQNPNISTAELDMALKMTKIFTNPIMLPIVSIFNYTFMSFIFSLIISIFLKRKPKEEI